jgi:predicted nucleotidyltransferase
MAQSRDCAIFVFWLELVKLTIFAYNVFMTTVHAVSKEILEVAQKVAVVSGAEKIILFGSVAQGNASAKSDLDFLLLFSDDAPMLEATAKAQQAFWQSKLDLDLVPMRLSHFEKKASVLARTVAREGISVYG